MKRESGFRVRPATAEDVAALLELKLALQEHVERTNPRLLRLAADGPARLADEYRRAVSDPDSLIIVAEASGAVVGLAAGKIVLREEMEPARTGHINGVWVTPEFRRRGVCRSMFAALMVFFEASQIDKLVLDYIVGDEPAERTWKELGFEPILTIATTSRQDAQRRLDRRRD